MIACILIPHFATAVERRERAERDRLFNDRPLILTRTHGRQERVYAVSADVADGASGGSGVQPGLKLAQAETLCPEAQVIPALISRYVNALAELLDVLAPFGDKPEVDEDFPRDVTIYLDLGRLRPSDALALGDQIRVACNRLKLPSSIGFAAGKFTAFAAAVSTQTLRLVSPDGEAAFLAPLPVALLPLDGDMERELWLLGVERLGQFAALPRGAVLGRFGKRGRLLHDLAAGRDGRLLRPYVPPKRERVLRRFESPIADRQVLEAALGEATRELAERLERGAAAVQQIVLLLHLENGTIDENVMNLRQPLAGTVSLRRVLSRTLERMRIGAPVAVVEVIFEQLVADQPRQLSLFDDGANVDSTQQKRKADQTVQKLVSRFGESGFYHAVPGGSLPTSPLPERRYRLERLDS